jgi:hypothetical protein
VSGRPKLSVGGRLLGVYLAGWFLFKKFGTRSGGSVVTLAELVAAAETRATEIINTTLRR